MDRRERISLTALALGVTLVALAALLIGGAVGGAEIGIGSMLAVAGGGLLYLHRGFAAEPDPEYVDDADGETTTVASPYEPDPDAESDPPAEPEPITYSAETMERTRRRVLDVNGTGKIEAGR